MQPSGAAEWLDGEVAKVLIDDRGVDVGRLGPLGQPVDHERVERVGVRNGDMACSPHRTTKPAGPPSRRFSPRSSTSPPSPSMRTDAPSTKCSTSSAPTPNQALVGTTEPGRCRE